MPIHFMHKSVSFDELIALYAVSDVCLVSSTRDGMNLVSYEYIATQQKRHGVMILSEFTGAAQSLNGSLIVNPWNTEELADAIYDAVTMGDEQRAINYHKLAKYVNKYTRYFKLPIPSYDRPLTSNLAHGGASLSSASSQESPSTPRANSKSVAAQPSTPQTATPNPPNDRKRHQNQYLLPRNPWRPKSTSIILLNALPLLSLLNKNTLTLLFVHPNSPLARNHMAAHSIPGCSPLGS
jgi:trehalose 6-phosphate synthase